MFVLPSITFGDINAAFFLCGCSPFIPKKYPVKLRVLLHMLSAQFTLLAAIYAWTISNIIVAHSQDSHTSCVQMKGTENRQEGNWAIVPYTQQTPLQGFQERNRTVSLNQGNIKVSIVQDWNQHGVAGVVWDASVVLSEYLIQNPHLVKGKTVVELGAGTAIPSIVAAHIGASKVIATDLPSATPLLDKNVKANLKPLAIPSHLISVSSLKWGGPELGNIPKSDVILGADIVYDQSVFTDLLDTVEHFLSLNSKAEALLACRVRYERDEDFLKLFRQRFDVTRVLYDPKTDIHVYRAQFS